MVNMKKVSLDLQARSCCSLAHWEAEQVCESLWCVLVVLSVSLAFRFDRVWLLFFFFTELTESLRYN